MQFPLWYLLIIYAVFVLVAGVFVFFNVFHIAKFGLQNTKTTIVLSVYVVGYIGALVLSLAILSTFDWSAMIDMSQLFPGGSTTTIL